MKQLKKWVGVLMMTVMVTTFVGCGNGSTNPVSSEPVSTQVAEVQGESQTATSDPGYKTTIKLASEVTDLGTYSAIGPEGWAAEVQEVPTGKVVQYKGEGADSVVVMYMQGEEYKGMDLDTYMTEFEKGLKQKASEKDLNMSIAGKEKMQLANGEVGVFLVEMPFKAEAVDGWIAAGNLTQAQIDEAGGKEAFVANTKVSQVQVYMMTSEGWVSVIASSIKGTDYAKEYALGVASTVTFK